MGLIQIVLIWGAASSALFSPPVQSGEWENFKDLKEALVRSSSKRDIPLPRWAANLDYPRPFHFYDLPVDKRVKNAPVSASDTAAVNPRSDDDRPGGLRRISE